MDSNILDKYLLAGKIAYDAKQTGKELIKERHSLYEVAEKIEQFIVEKGGNLAFPVNLSINNEAAHYTPSFKDTSVFNRGDIVKLDLGVHIDGYIADTALTIEVSTYLHEPLIKASREALITALGTIKENALISDVGSAVERVMNKWNVKPVSNLTGHMVDRYLLHGKKSVWNIRNSETTRFEKNEAYAIEPFASTGTGFVENSKNGNIYRFIKNVSKSKKDIYMIYEKYSSLPFAMRWIQRDFPEISPMKLNQYIQPYPVLIDRKGSLISQAEETIIVQDNGIIVTTNKDIAL
ncbi:MAG: type II methionyl aminopeptidase [Candidatus Thermoplasmatota archaeon]|jgi:methionyl aminopeptidase|nr:type II methionyl aminopeptidase [Candidatus Thermoplasmatota archaeon]